MEHIKLPPQAIEVEQSILSTCLLYPDGIIAIEDYLRGDDFYRQGHSLVYGAMLELSKHKKPVDIATVVSALRDAGKLETVGGASYLAQLVEESPVCASIENSAKILRAKAVLRKTIEICNRTSVACFENEDPLQVIDAAQKEINNLDIGGQEEVSRIRDLVVPAVERHELAHARKGKLSGYPTGFWLLDHMLCGWQKGDLIILAARPGMGKTSLALSFDLRIPTAFFSLEMPKEQIVDKLLAKRSKVNGQKFRSGKFNEEDWPKINNAADEIYKLPLYIDDSSALHYMEVRRRVRKYIKQHHIRLVIIDYLQLMKGDAKANTRDQEIGSITRGLKALCKDENIPIVLLSQLNRKVEERANKRPMPSDLRESGSIEQDADVIIFPYRDEVYNDDPNNPNKGVAELDIAKQRMGPTGMVKLAWIKEYATFENLAREAP